MKYRVKSFMKELGFNKSGDIIFGIFDGYLASVTDVNGTASIYIDISLGDTADIEREKIRSFVEANARQYSILLAEVKNTGVLVLFESSISAFSKLRDFFYFFVRHLSSMHIPGASVCTNCGKPISSISIISINGRLHTCDKECAAHLMETSDSGGAAAKRRVYFIPGFIGAVFGAFFGAVPFVVLSRIGVHAVWSGIVIGLFAKGGFEFFGGQKSIGKAVALPLLSFLASVPAVFMYYCYTLSRIWQSFNYIFQFREAIQAVFTAVKTSPSLQTAMLTDAVLTFAFAALSILLFAKLTGKQSLKSVYIVS